jgi:ligand-binding sensor domain-containing protein
LAPIGWIDFESVGFVTNLKSMRNAVILALSLNLIVTNCVGQLPSYNFHHVTTSNGLSDGVVRAIGQDKYGYIWIATLSGLNRYNGYSVKQYQNIPGDSLSLPSGATRSLLGDAAGNLWIGTNSGLYWFDYTSSQFHHVNWPNNFSVIKMIQCGRDEIYLGTNRGLAKFIPSLKKISFYDSTTPDKRFLSFRVNDACFHKRSLYLATDSGLIAFDIKTETSRVIPLKPVTDKSINRIAVDGNGNIWASYGYIGELLVKCDSSFKNYQVFDDFYYTSQNVLGNNIANFFVDNRKRLWIATTFQGLVLYDDKSKRFMQYVNDPLQPSTPSSNQYVTAFQDKQGFIWLGSEGYGVDYFHPDKNFIKIIAPVTAQEPLLPSLWGRAVAEDKDGNLWLGWGGALTRQREDDSIFKIWKNVKDRPKEIHYNSIRSLLCDENGDVWIGTANGVNRYRKSTGRMDFFDEKDSLPLSFYWCILKDSRKTIWFGNRDNFFYYDSTRTGVHSSGYHPILFGHKGGVRCMMEDSKHRLWFGMNGAGLMMYDPQKKTVNHWRRTKTNDTTLLDNIVTSIAEDKKGVVWASFNIGLISYDPQTNKFTQYTRKNGLPSIKTSSLAVDEKNRLWIGSTSGLLMLDSSRQHFKTFDTEDGLPTMEFNDQAAYQMKDGRFILPSLKGFVVFDPNNYKENVRSPELYLSALRVHNVEYKSSSNYEDLKQLKLKYDENFFSLELSALNYANPGQTWYAYKLEPFDKDWNYTKERIVNYTNVPGGDYVFYYKATADPNNWRVPEKFLKISVGTVFYKAAWFWILVLFGIASFFFWLYNKRIEHRERVYSLQNKAQILEKEKALVQYESLKQQLNPHFLFNSLTSLSSLIQQDQNLARKFLDQMSKIYRYILSNRDTELVPLIEDIKLVQVYTQLQQTRFQTGLNVNIDVGEENYSRKIVPVTLQNLIENAIKHNIVDGDRPLNIDILTDDGYLIVRNNLQKKNFVQSSNKQGLTNMKSLYHYLDQRPMIIKEDEVYFTVKIPLI